MVCYRSRRSTSYYTYITYSYSANESLYGSPELEVNRQKIYFSEDGAREDLQERFPIGKNMDVYYNPSNPSESSLGLAGAPSPLVPIVFFLAAFGIVGLARHER